MIRVKRENPGINVPRLDRSVSASRSFDIEAIIIGRERVDSWADKKGSAG
jgi:hypothetical protein